MTTEQRLDQIEALLAQLIKSDRYTMEKHLQLLDGRHIQTGVTTGTKIASTTTQRLGFFGAIPISQPVSPTFPSGGSTIDFQARSSINQIINTFSANLGGLGLTA